MMLMATLFRAHGRVVKMPQCDTVTQSDQGFMVAPPARNRWPILQVRGGLVLHDAEGRMVALAVAGGPSPPGPSRTRAIGAAPRHDAAAGCNPLGGVENRCGHLAASRASRSSPSRHRRARSGVRDPASPRRAASCEMPAARWHATGTPLGARPGPADRTQSNGKRRAFRGRRVHTGMIPLLCILRR